VLLRAADRFHAQHGRYPGAFDSSVEDDCAALRGIAVQLLQELGVGGASVQVRGGGWAAGRPGGGGGRCSAAPGGAGGRGGNCCSCRNRGRCRPARCCCQRPPAPLASLPACAPSATHLASHTHTTPQDDYVAEVVRFGAGELHVMGAIVGGMAAQEAIKLITQQFVPFSGALVYNAVGSTTSVLDF
jgi:amyloid beta precursor protein binding protein 1